jgi:hypothetical protein
MSSLRSVDASFHDLLVLAWESYEGGTKQTK